VLTDFGAESSFAQAVQRVKEHYGIEVPISAVREQTLRHGRAIGSVAERVPAVVPSQEIITQLDGSMVPVMKPGSGEDARKGKTLFWREVRLCCARGQGQSQSVYGATLGSVESVGWVWQQTAQRAGCQQKSWVHGVGDGAPWIVEKFKDHFGTQGRYLIDFFHVSEYLAAAAPKLVRPGKERQWLHRQQGRLLMSKCRKYCGVWKTIRNRRKQPKDPSPMPTVNCRSAGNIYFMLRPGDRTSPLVLEKLKALTAM